MRSQRWLVFSVVAAVSASGAALAACGSPNLYREQDVNVGLGETCGELQQTPNEIQAICTLDAGFTTDAGIAGGPSCVLLDFTPFRIGLCAPTCGSGAPACPSGFACETLGDQNRIAEVCAKPCSSTAGCPAPIQVCLGGYCQTHGCQTGADCGPGASCANGLCVTQDASVH
jgi:hypothetical protein